MCRRFSAWPQMICGRVQIVAAYCHSYASGSTSASRMNYLNATVVEACVRPLPSK